MRASYIVFIVCVCGGGHDPVEGCVHKGHRTKVWAVIYIYIICVQQFSQDYIWDIECCLSVTLDYFFIFELFSYMKKHVYTMLITFLERMNI